MRGFVLRDAANVHLRRLWSSIMDYMFFLFASAPSGSRCGDDLSRAKLAEILALRMLPGNRLARWWGCLAPSRSRAAAMTTTHLVLFDIDGTLLSTEPSRGSPDGGSLEHV